MATKKKTATKKTSKPPAAKKSTAKKTASKPPATKKKTAEKKPADEPKKPKTSKSGKKLGRPAKPKSPRIPKRAELIAAAEDMNEKMTLRPVIGAADDTEKCETVDFKQWTDGEILEGIKVNSEIFEITDQLDAKTEATLKLLGIKTPSELRAEAKKTESKKTDGESAGDEKTDETPAESGDAPPESAEDDGKKTAKKPAKKTDGEPKKRIGRGVTYTRDQANAEAIKECRKRKRQSTTITELAEMADAYFVKNGGTTNAHTAQNTLRRNLNFAHHMGMLRIVDNRVVFE